MELYIKEIFSDITYKSELTPHHFQYSVGEIRKWWGVNSPKQLTFTVVP
jgi:hypothetical protein